MAVKLHATHKKTDSSAAQKAFSDSCASYYCAAHEVLLVWSVRNIVCVQYTKVDLCAAHFMSHACSD